MNIGVKVLRKVPSTDTEKTLNSILKRLNKVEFSMQSDSNILQIDNLSKYFGGLAEILKIKSLLYPTVL